MYDSRPSVAPLMLRPACCTESARCSARFTRLSGSGCVDCPLRQPLRRAATDPPERPEHVARSAYVVAILHHVAEAEHVRLGFIVTTELEEEQLHSLLQLCAHVPHRRRCDHPGDQAHLRQLRLAHLAHRMLRGHVPDLVPDHRRQLCLVVHVRHDAAGDEDESPRQREGVHGLVIQQVELPRQVGALRLGRHAHPDLLTSAWAAGFWYSPMDWRTFCASCWPMEISCDSETRDSSDFPETGLVAQATVATARNIAVMRLDMRKPLKSQVS